MQIRMKTFALCILAALAVAFAPAAWADGKLPVITYRDMDKIETMDLNQIAEEAKKFGETPDVEKTLRMCGSITGERYPTYEIIAIDGKPWQETKYADLIQENLTWFGVSYFNRYPDLMEIALDPRFNGKGATVWKLYQQGKSVDEIKAILGGGKTEPQEPVPGKEVQGTEPQESVPDNSGTAQSPAPAPAETVVLYLNRKDYSVARDNTWQNATLDVPPTVANNRTLIPLRGLLEQFGATVDWDKGSGQINVSYGDKKVVLTLGSAQAVVNGKEVSLDAPATSRNGRTLIPLRFVSEGIGMDVQWDEKTQSITVKQPALTHQS